MQSIDIYRAGVLYNTIKPDPNAVQAKRIMQENELRLTFRMNHYVDFRINDYCTVFGEVYTLNQMPIVKKESSLLFEYTFVMQGTQGDLTKAQYLFLGADNTLRESDFSLMGNLNDFLSLVVQNANRVSPTWIKGEVLNTTQYKNLTFSKANCYEALQQIAEEFNTEFWVEGKKIHLTKKTIPIGYTFKVGKYRGLYNIVRQNQDGLPVATRLFAFGSEKNLPPDYRDYSPRLRFPGGVDACLPHDVLWTVTLNGDGTQTIVFTWTMISTGSLTFTIMWRLQGSNLPFNYNHGLNTGTRTMTLPVGTYDIRFRSMGGICGGKTTGMVTLSGTITTPLFPYEPYPYLEQNVDKYGVIEHTQIFEDIYPHRTGKVTSVNAGNPFVFSDSGMDFDVNTYLLPGLTPKVVFNTGQLAGYEFEVSEYNNGSKQFTILKNKDERVIEVPSTTIKPAIGDEYVLIDITLPQVYIDDAEEELLQAAQDYLNTKSTPQVRYILTLDPVYVRDNLLKTLEIGGDIWVQDDDLGLLRSIRIVAATRSILNEYEYTLELADFVSKSRFTDLELGIATIGRNLTNVRRVVNRLRDTPLPP